MDTNETLKNLRNRLDGYSFILSQKGHSLSNIGLKELGDLLLNLSLDLSIDANLVHKVNGEIVHKALKQAEEFHKATVGKVINDVFKNHGKYTIIYGSGCVFSKQVEVDPHTDLIKQIADKYNINPGSIWYIFKGWPENA